MKITMSEATVNQQNTIVLTGEHPLAGATQLAKREHNRQTGDVRRYAGIGAEHKQFVEKDWPKAVKAAVKKWKEKIHSLEVMNAQGDNIGRELFASLTED